jgi:hypothetical protein
MSNKTTPAESPLEGTVIPPTTNDVPVAEAPKAPSKIKNALRHPVTTVKKHKLPITAAVSAVAGGAAVMLLKAKVATSKDDVVEESQDDEFSNLILLESYADEEN